MQHGPKLKAGRCIVATPVRLQNVFIYKKVRAVYTKHGAGSRDTPETRHTSGAAGRAHTPYTQRREGRGQS